MASVQDRFHVTKEHTHHFLREAGSDKRFFVWCDGCSAVVHEWESAFAETWMSATYSSKSMKIKLQNMNRDATMYKSIVELDPKRIVCVPCKRNLASSEVSAEHKQSAEHRNNVAATKGLPPFPLRYEGQSNV